MLRREKYYLENENGERKGLNLSDEITLSNVEGLGTSIGNKTVSVKNGFFTEVFKEENLVTIEGDLVYKKRSLETYHEFITWLFAAEKLCLIYDPTGTEYKRNVLLGQIEKDHPGAGGWLSAHISLLPITPWYKTEIISGSSINIVALGQLDSGIVVTLSGASTPVSISLGDFGGIELTEALSYEQTLEYSTISSDSHIYIDGKDSIIKAAELENIYPKVPAGSSAVLECTDGTMSVEVYHYWRSV